MLLPWKCFFNLLDVQAQHVGHLSMSQGMVYRRQSLSIRRPQYCFQRDCDMERTDVFLVIDKQVTILCFAIL